jgi:3'(2'), 5'-bisphosphate nucleotidase
MEKTVRPDAARELLDETIRVADAAAREIMAVYESTAGSRSKADGSPVTDADDRACAVIGSALAPLIPGCPIVCEESAIRPEVGAATKRFWLVDPLDGTKEFLQRNGEFTVNIALVEEGRPVLGVVLAPALGRLFAGVAGSGAFLRQGGSRAPLGCRSAPAEGLTVVGSRSHADNDAMNAFLGGRRVARMLSAGSSLKFCMVAAGEADLYPRLGTTMEWDTAAGHAVLSAAGGQVTCVDGTVLAYGKPGLVNPHFVAMGR